MPARDAGGLKGRLSCTCAECNIPEALYGDCTCSAMMHDSTPVLRTCALVIVKHGQPLNFNFVGRWTQWQGTSKLLTSTWDGPLLSRRTILLHDKTCKTSRVRCSICCTLSHRGRCNYLRGTQFFNNTPPYSTKAQRVLQGHARSTGRWPSAQSTVGCTRKVDAIPQTRLH